MRIQKTISPIDGSVYDERELASAETIDHTLNAAVAAQKAWRETTITNRAAVCRSMVAHILGRTNALATELTWQMGRPIRYTPFEISGGFQERALHMIAIAEMALADVQVAEKAGFTRFIRREPLGVVLVLAPWNYPWLTSVNAIVPALMAGNSVILKHSGQTPLVADAYAQAFAAAGAPTGLFQVLDMTHDDVAAVISDKRVDYVAFTGSVPGGNAVERAAAGRFIGSGLELGGKDPAYIRADADLDFAIANVVDGAFFNSGQSCCGVERIYVHQSRFDAFVEGAVALTRQYLLGDPLDAATMLGPMVRTRAADFVRGQIAAAIAAGAKPLIDPVAFSASKAGTPYLAPQILINVDHSMAVMREESFGPVVGIMPVKDDAHAIALMNDSDFGLTASVWTPDVEAALRVGDQIETGTWFMNRCDYLDPALAWTGVKDSGRGCTLSSLGYHYLTRPKSYHLRTTIK